MGFKTYAPENESSSFFTENLNLYCNTTIVKLLTI